MQTSPRPPFDFPVPIVSAIIERQRDGEIEVLVQTRWKPDKDPKYSGTLEIPAGGIGPFENIYDALRREVFEETGLNVIGFRPDTQTKLHSQRSRRLFGQTTSIGKNIESSLPPCSRLGKTATLLTPSWSKHS